MPMVEESVPRVTAAASSPSSSSRLPLFQASSEHPFEALPHPSQSALLLATSIVILLATLAYIRWFGRGKAGEGIAGLKDRMQNVGGPGYGKTATTTPDASRVCC